MKVNYLNTDLELVSSAELSAIVAEFGEDVVVLADTQVHGKWFTSFEIAGSTSDPESVIEYFCMLAEALTPETRAVWDACHSRTVDLGFEGGTDHASYSSSINASTIARMASNGMALGVTVYPQTK